MNAAGRARLAAKVAGVALGSVGAAGAAALAGATVFARKVLTPDPRRPDDVIVKAVTETEVTLQATPDTTAPGRYGLWLDGGAGHAQIGEVLAVNTRDGVNTVTRQLLAVDVGAMRPGPARWDSYVYSRDPQRDLGLETEHMYVEGELGALPAWLVPAPGATVENPGSRWAILVHGRAARRQEGIRAIPALHAAGLTCLIPSYRNDTDAHPDPDGRYSLGLTEWRDIDSALHHAVAMGATEVVLVGWSMGGAIVLQTLKQSPIASVVSRAILDGPVVDWGDVLRHQASVHKVPGPVGRLGTAIMGAPSARVLVGINEPVKVELTNWIKRSDELTHPMLVIHSRDDEWVPSGPSEELAAARPDLITFAPWSLALHCKEWNVDPARWDALVTAYASAEIGPPTSADSTSQVS